MDRDRLKRLNILKKKLKEWEREGYGLITLLLVFTLHGCVGQNIRGDTLVWSHPEKKPKWVPRPVGRNQYKGISTQNQTQEDALKNAGNNALRHIVEEVGVNVNAVFEMEKMEKGSELNIKVKNRTKTITQAAIQGAKIIDRYIEKYKRTKPTTNYFYNAYVLVEIPEGEIEKARERIKEYNRGIVKEAKELFTKAEEKEKSYPYHALVDYRTIFEMLRDVDLASAKALSTSANKKIEYLEEMKDPMVRLLSLEGNAPLIREIELTDAYGKGYEYSGPNFLDVGNILRIKLNLVDDGYLYIIGYDKESKENRLLFPNRIERNNYAVEGVKIYPDSTGFVAEPPPGFNMLFIIVSKEEIPIPPFTTITNYIPLTKENMWRFLRELKKIHFDIKDVGVYIREE
jgi:hypothetical protein